METTPPGSWPARHPATTFLALTLGSSGAILGLLAASGVEQLFMLGTLGPAVAALVTVGLVDGPRAAFGGFLVRALRWRFGLRWWAVALLLPLLVTVAAFALSGATGGPGLSQLTVPALAGAVPLVVLLTLVNGIPEELGWRGFLLPVVQRRASALVASLVVGVAAGAWHAPIYFVDGSFHATLRAELGFWAAFGLFTAATTAFSVGYTWLVNGVGGSALAAGVLHGAANGWFGAGYAGLSEAEVVTVFAWFSAVWVAVVAAVAVVAGPRDLSRTRARVTEYLPTPRGAVPRCGPGSVRRPARATRPGPRRTGEPAPRPRGGWAP